MLKKKLLYIGIFLIFIGIINVSYSNFFIEIPNPVEVRTVSNQWEASYTFHKGDKIIVNIKAPETWRRAFARAYMYIDPSTGLPLMEPINATIVCPPPNNYTILFKVFLGAAFDVTKGDFIMINEREALVVIYKIELLSQEGSDLEVGNPPTEIGGVVKKDGTYTVQFHPVPDTFLEFPPEKIIIYNELRERTYPYSFLSYIGVSLIFLGIILSISELRKKYKRKL